MLLCIGCMGAWAQTQVTTLNTSKYYTLACSSTGHDATKVCLADVDGTIIGRSTSNTFFQFEAGESDGQYYIKSVASNKYVVASGTTDGSTVSLSDTKDTYWTVAATGTALYIRPNESTNTYLNNNLNDSPNLQIANGNGDCSKWKVCEYSAPINVNPLKGYKLKLKGTEYYLKFNTEYNEDAAVNATTASVNGSVFSICFATTGSTLKWRNEYMKTTGSYGWNSGHGTDAANSTWKIAPVEGEENTYYLMKGESGDVYFGQRDPVNEGTYFYTNVGSDANYIKWELEETTYDAMMVNQGYWPETSTSAAPKYYSIRNTRNGNYFARYVASNKNMALVNLDNFDANCYFYFENVVEDGLPYDVKAVKIRNAAAPNYYCAAVNSYNNTGITWYIKKGVYNNSETVAINSNKDIWNNNSYGWNNQSNSNTTIATYASTDVGSTWEVKPLNDTPHAIAPVMSTADNKRFYKFVNFRQNKYADSQSENAAITEETNLGLGSFWYFEDASAENTAQLNEGVIPCYIINAYVGKYLKSHSTATNSSNATYTDNKNDAQIWYLTPYNKGNNNDNDKYYGYGIGKTTSTSDNVAWNDLTGTSVCQYAVNDAGSIWKFVPATNAEAYTLANNAITNYKRHADRFQFADYFRYEQADINAYADVVKYNTPVSNGDIITNLQMVKSCKKAFDVIITKQTRELTPKAGDKIRFKNRAADIYINHANADATTFAGNGTKSDNNLWLVEGDATNGFAFKNVATQKYIGSQTTKSANFPASDTPVYFDITKHQYSYAVFRVHGATGGFAYGHINGGNLVCWETSEASQWAIEGIESLDVAKQDANDILSYVGTGYPSDAPRTALQNAVNGSEATSQTINDAITQYMASTDVTLPEAGKAYNLISVHSDGKKYYVNYAESGISLVAVGSEPLPETAKFYANTISAGRYVFATADGNYLAWKGSSAGTNGNKGYTTTFDATESNIGIEKMATGGQYNSGTSESLFGLVDILGHRGSTEVCFIVNNGGTFNQDGSKVLRFNNDHSTAWLIEEVENSNTIKLTKPTSSVEGGLNGKYVGTFSAPYNVELRDGVVAYTAAVEGNHVTFNELGRIVPKNTGVLVYAEGADATINENAIPAAVTSAEMPTIADGSNKLVGTNGIGVTVPAETNAYILSKDDTEGVKFYKLTTTGNRTIARNKAYLDLTGNTTEVRSFSFDFEGMVTDIEHLNVVNESQSAYDLAGRSVKAQHRGLYIIDGKKVIR